MAFKDSRGTGVTLGQIPFGKVDVGHLKKRGGSHLLKEKQPEEGSRGNLGS